MVPPESSGAAGRVTVMRALTLRQVEALGCIGHTTVLSAGGVDLGMVC